MLVAEEHAGRDARALEDVVVAEAPHDLDLQDTGALPHGCCEFGIDELQDALADLGGQVCQAAALLKFVFWVGGLSMTETDPGGSCFTSMMDDLGVARESL